MDQTQRQISTAGVYSATQENLELDSNQETPRPRSGPGQLELMDARIQTLLSRKYILLWLKRFRTTSRDCGAEAAEENSSDDEVFELELVEKELQELRVRMKELEEGGEDLSAPTGQDHLPRYKPETSCGGIFILPPYRPARGGGAPAVPPAEPAPLSSDSLRGSSPAAAHCPSCGQAVVTQVKRRVGQTTWLICWLCSIIGCFAGCCLIPFFMDHLKSSVHHCPQCEAHIHTHHPF